jgi:hypothetical protein
MTTNQGNIIAAIETQLGLSGLSYNEAIFQLATNTGIAATDFNSMLAQYLTLATGSTETNINGLLAAYAAIYFDGNINAINSLTAGEFTFTVKTDNAGTSNTDQFTFPLVSGGTYNFTAYASDGTVFHCNDYTANTMTFNSGAGTYTVRVVGTLSGWQFSNKGDCLKYLTTEQVGILNFGNQPAVTAFQTFFGAENHLWNATDLQYMTGITQLAQVWRNNSALTTIPGLGRLINTNITALNGAFVSADNFNEPSISEANTSNVTMFTNFLNGCVNFNQDISNFNFEAINVTTGLDNFLLFNTEFSTANYDALLISMAAQTIFAGQAPHFGDATWSFGYAGQARFTMLADGTFSSMTDGGQADSTQGVWLNPHNLLKATANPTDGTAVTSWKDLSDNNNNADNSSGSQRPTFQTNIANGEPMILFDGLDSYLEIVAHASIDDLFITGGFVFAVIKPLSDGEANQGRIFSQGGGNNFFDLVSESGGACKLKFTKAFSTTAGQWTTTNLDININQVNVVAVYYDGSSTSNDPVIYVNSTTPVAITEDSTPVGTITASSTIRVGNAGITNKTFDGYIGDLAFFKKTPTTQEISNYFDYGSIKYGVNLS